MNLRNRSTRRSKGAEHDVARSGCSLFANLAHCLAYRFHVYAAVRSGQEFVCETKKEKILLPIRKSVGIQAASDTLRALCRKGPGTRSRSICQVDKVKKRKRRHRREEESFNSIETGF